MRCESDESCGVQPLIHVTAQGAATGVVMSIKIAGWPEGENPLHVRDLNYDYPNG